MNVLVTGGTGLVGNGIKEEFLKSSYFSKYNFLFLSSKDYDLTNLEEVKSLFSKYKPKMVIHLAADVGGLYKNMRQKSKMFENNFLINFNVLKCCADFNVEKCVSCLSTCVFPDEIEYPISENMLHNGPPHNSNYTYAYSKRILEVQSRAYCEDLDKNFVCVIPTNIYGKHDNFSLQDGHVIPALIHNCYLAKKDKRPFIVKGSGKALRQFIHSSDLGKLILLVLKDYENNDSIILSVDEKDEVTIEYIARKIASEMDYEDNLVFDKSYSDGQIKKTADNSKLKIFLGDNNFKFKSIDEGLKETIDWFIKNYPNVRQ